MAIKSELKGVKLVLDLEKGSQTISGCNSNATDEKLGALAKTIGTLESTNIAGIVKVVETKLIEE